MSAITPERIAELRRQYPMMWSRNRAHHPFGHFAYSTLDINELLDALESSRAEVQRLRDELDSANADADSAERVIANLRTSWQGAIADVQRLTEEARRSPSPQPATVCQPSADVVVVPRAEYNALESVRYHATEIAAGIREIGPSRLSEPLEHALEHLDALRSSTNHDSKETP